MLETFLSVIQKFEKENIPYMVVGSIASMMYGEVRLTHDMDMVIDILPVDIKKIETLFPLSEFYCPPLEVLKSEMASRGQFNLIHHQTGLKIDVVIRKATAHAVEEFGRRSKKLFWQDAEVYVASPEDVILKKLDFFREGGSDKHLRDIRGILAETQVDRRYLDLWIGKLGLMGEWGKV